MIKKMEMNKSKIQEHNVNLRNTQQIQNEFVNLIEEEHVAKIL